MANHAQTIEARMREVPWPDSLPASAYRPCLTLLGSRTFGSGLG